MSLHGPQVGINHQWACRCDVEGCTYAESFTHLGDRNVVTIYLITTWGWRFDEFLNGGERWTCPNCQQNRVSLGWSCGCEVEGCEAAFKTSHAVPTGVPLDLHHLNELAFQEARRAGWQTTGERERWLCPDHRQRVPGVQELAISAIMKL